ncbi:type I 3-dehydroquinate dehydratase [Evansella cellulosilytica]|uniref:3-dehydroquinate dehydratase n=1 Tax=Evansella cellulosilytica (strain ATCC 21833 / DSM 2522 / FERM P-1141 / JCM 9156 / N-4) TaxID=649639 RepID=E6TX16_EVAC2|nr:type I 3-dehydroquinate dehydratase [Evansella cellulosilytica]ADU31105.1 3-dehydroquinate dehydratase, type I [Evansella cellulosilytica DSM 2522]
MKTYKVNNIVIGEGTPKICVPIVGETMKELIEEAMNLENIAYDLVEWRVDFFHKVFDLEEVLHALREIRKILKDAPIIFTFRTAKEGGEKEISSSTYFELNKRIAESRLVDFIDVELFQEEKSIRSLITFAHEKDVRIIASNHDFEKTPSEDDIIHRLKKAQYLGADIPKIAVMPNNNEDVLTLLSATNRMKEYYADRPFITMSMKGMGLISRISGELFGSAITFGSAKKSSAPGQIPVAELRQLLSVISNNMND